MDQLTSQLGLCRVLILLKNAAYDGPTMTRLEVGVLESGRASWIRRTGLEIS